MRITIPLRNQHTIIYTLFFGLCLLLLSPALQPGWILSPAGLLQNLAPWDQPGMYLLGNLENNPVWDQPVIYPVDVPENDLLWDQAVLFNPWQAYTRRMMAEGRFPLWNPLSYGGVPHLANLQSAVFYPVNLLLLAVPQTEAGLWSALIRLWLAGVFMYHLMLRHTRHRWIAAAAGITFMFCAFNMVWLGHPHANVSVLLPLVLLLTRRLMERITSGRVAGLAAAVAVQFTGGHIETSALLLLACGYWALCVPLASGGSTRRTRGLTAVAVAWILGAAGAAVILLPFTEYLFHSDMLAHRLGTRKLIPFTGDRRWMLWFLPHYYGNPVSGTYTGPSNFTEAAVYVGLFPLLLLGCVPWSRRVSRVFGGLAVLAMIPAWYLPPFNRLICSSPLSSMAWERTSLLAQFAMAGLMVPALDALRRREIPPWRIPLAGAVLAGAGTALAPVLGFAGLLAAGLLALILPLMVRRTWILAACVLIFISADTILHWRGFNTAIPESAWYPRNKPISRLESGTRNTRFMAFEGIFPPALSMMYGVADIRGHDSLSPEGIRRFWNLANDPPSTGKHPALNAWDPAFLGYCNVARVMHRGAWNPVAVHRLLRAGDSVFIPMPGRGEVTTIDLISALRGSGQMAQGAQVCTLVVETLSGEELSFPLRAGVNTAEYSRTPAARHRQVKFRRAFPGTADSPAGSLYHTWVGLPGEVEIAGIRIRDITCPGEFYVDSIGAFNDWKLRPADGCFKHNNRLVQPRVTVPETVEIVGDEAQVWERMTRQNWRHPVCLLAARGTESLGTVDQIPSRAGISGYADSGNTVSFDCSFSEPVRLLIRNNYFPGWTARFSKSHWYNPADRWDRVPVRRANAVFQSIALPAGTFSVEMEYAPVSFMTGAFLTLLFCGFLAGIAARFLRRRR